MGRRHTLPTPLTALYKCRHFVLRNSARASPVACDIVFSLCLALFPSRKMRLVGAIDVFLAVLILLVWSASKGRPVSGHDDSYVREACSVTRYQDVCIRSLASFSSSARRSPSRWARAGVSVALSEAKTMARYLEKVKRDGQIHGRRQRIALSDCTECFQDSIDNLHRCLGILRVLTETGQFGSEIDDLITWMSTALTNEDTCLDGFDGEQAKQVKLIRQRVLNATYLTSNALALANKLATNTDLD